MKVINFLELFCREIRKNSADEFIRGGRGDFSHDSNAMFGKKSNSGGVRGGS